MERYSGLAIRKHAWSGKETWVKTGKPLPIWTDPDLDLVIDGKPEKVYVDYKILLNEKDYERPYAPDFVSGGWRSEDIKIDSITQALPADEKDKRDFTEQVKGMISDPKFVRKLVSNAYLWLQQHIGRVFPLSEK